MTPNQKTKRLDTIFVLREWSDRDPHFADYQIGGLHFRPLARKGEPKIQVDHRTQQRLYAAIRRLMAKGGPEFGYSEAMNALLDLANVGLFVRENFPEHFAVAEEARRLKVEGVTRG